jgi:hypothetical protein
MKHPLLPTSVLCAIATLTACGGGGGGGGSSDFVGAAVVSLETTPSEIDSGDRTLVETDISQVHKNGIALKFRFPESLRYVRESAFLYINNKEIDLTPTADKLSDEDGSRYLVFFLKQSLFAKPGEKYDGNSGVVKLQLEGIDALKDGSIEVDADVDDPTENNSSEFDINKPEFVAEDETYIAVASE